MMWALAVAITLLLAGGAAQLASQELGLDWGRRAADRVFREPPRVLSRSEAAQGLAQRHRALRERFEAYAQRRSHAVPEDYTIAAPPRGPGIRPRPDAPGGEFRRGGGR